MTMPDDEGNGGDGGESMADAMADEMQRHSDAVDEILGQAGMTAGDDNEGSEPD
jgi:hypothetical protein